MLTIQSDRNPLLCEEPTPLSFERLRVAPTDEGLTVLILARDDAFVLEGTLQALNQLLGREDHVQVVADHCLDGTARVAREAGATVHVRSHGNPDGKGAALRWWLDQTRNRSRSDEIILVLDADSQVAPDFLETIRRHFKAGAMVVQARVEPLVLSPSPVARLAAFSEIVEQRVNDALRNRLGWSVRLRGTGMAFRRDLLDRYSRPLHTLVEDVELTILLGAAGVHIVQAGDTYVVDPKPVNPAGAMRQRARWLRGQFQVVQAYSRPIAALLARGLSGWSLLSSVLIKPKTLILPAKAALTGAACLASSLLGGPLWICLAGLGALSILIDGAVYLYGLRFVPDRAATLRALALAPLYLAMWLRSFALSRVSGNSWLRSRPVRIEVGSQGLKGPVPGSTAVELGLGLRLTPSVPAWQPSVGEGGD